MDHCSTKPFEHAIKRPQTITVCKRLSAAQAALERPRLRIVPNMLIADRTSGVLLFRANRLLDRAWLSQPVMDWPRKGQALPTVTGFVGHARGAEEEEALRLQVITSGALRPVRALDLGELARQRDEVGERRLGVLPEVAGGRLVALDVDAQRRARPCRCPTGGRRCASRPRTSCARPDPCVSEPSTGS